MKKILIPIFAIVLLFGCKSNTKTETKDSVNGLSSANRETLSPQTKELIKKFTPLIKGIWVKDDYIEKLGKTKSSLAAMAEADGITEMHIDPDEISGDSLKVPVGLENHEGGQFILKFQPGVSNNSLKVYSGSDISGDFSEIGIAVMKGDTSLMLRHFNRHKKLLGNIKYKRIFDNFSDAGGATHYIVNKQIISGRYTVKDSLGASSTVNFTNEGIILGFLGFKNYSIKIDFNGPESNLDEIFFDCDEYSQNSKKGLGYSFKFNADTLNLYEIHENADSVDLILGKLKYKLVRQK